MSGKFVITVSILLGLLLGSVVGQLLYDPNWTLALAPEEHRHSFWLQVFSFFGFTIFMGLLKMLIVPLVAVSVIVGISSVGEFGKLGKMGTWTIVYYLSTMLIAVTIGLIVVNTVQPGVSFGGEDVAELSAVAEEGTKGLPSDIQQPSGLMGVFEHLVTMMIPENIIQAMAEGQTLSIITFSIFFGVVLLIVGEKARPVVRLVRSLFEVLMKMVELVLWLAPVGVFALLAWTIARVGLGVFGESIGLYMAAVMIGLFFHAFIVLPALLVFFASSSPFRFMHQMRSALMMAFATDSSSATLPVTIEVATQEAEVSEEAAGLVLPLGSVINMDGTALYEAVAVVFMAQAFGIELGLTQMIIVAFTATLAAIGAAGLPSAGLVTMFIVVDATNQSLLAANPETALIPAAGIGLIIGVDRILDMFRTTVNVWGDAVGAKIISEWSSKG